MNSITASEVFNIIAVVSYPELNAAGLHDHRLWGLLLLQAPGKLSLDALISRRYT